MPVSGFAWIASNPQVLAVWLALLNEDQRSAGTLGAILIRADAIGYSTLFTRIYGQKYCKSWRTLWSMQELLPAGCQKPWLKKSRHGR